MELCGDWVVRSRRLVAIDVEEIREVWRVEEGERWVWELAIHSLDPARVLGKPGRPDTVEVTAREVRCVEHFEEEANAISIAE